MVKALSAKLLSQAIELYGLQYVQTLDPIGMRLCVQARIAAFFVVLASTAVEIIQRLCHPPGGSGQIRAQLLDGWTIFSGGI